MQMLQTLITVFRNIIFTALFDIMQKINQRLLDVFIIRTFRI